MVKIVWTAPALQDLEDIGEYIGKDSERYAQEVVRSLFEATFLIKTLPKAGRIVPEFETNYLREIISGSYRIVDKYRVDILTVHHSAKQLKLQRISGSKK